jgi:SAM-dependent methyltransferase
MSDTSSRARYDEIAGFYETATGADATDPAARVVLEMVGDVHDHQILDLACGHGRLSRELARRRARVIAVDVSSRLLDSARSMEASASLGIDYRQVDVTVSDALEREVFDGVACNYGLSDIDDLDGALATVARVLRPNGRFVFSILHPCFPGWGTDAPSAWPPDRGYHQEGWWLADNSGFRGKVGSHFRMLSTYVNALVRHGLVIERVEEPGVPPEWIERSPGYVPVPYSLVVRCYRR